MNHLRALLREYVGRYRFVVALLMLNVPLVGAILAANLGGVPPSAITWSYAAAVIVGYYSVSALLALSVLFVVLFAWRRTLAAAAVTVLSLYVYYLLLDALVYHTFKFHIDFFWLEFLVQDFHGLGIPTSMVVTALAGFVVVVALELGLVAVARRVQQRRIVALFPLIALVALALSQTVHVFAYEKNDVRVTGVTPHFPFYVPTTSHGEAVKYGDMLWLAQADSAVGDAAEPGGTLRYPLAEIRCHAAPVRHPNIVYILLESWRFDMMNDEVSPNIAALSHRSSVFLNHFSSGNSTVAGLFGMFYGLHATYWTAVKANSARIDNPVLIDLLRENHYRFGVYAESSFDRHKIKDTVFNGIEVHNRFEGRTTDEKDEDLTRQVIEFFREQEGSDTPFMAFAFYKSSHFNYSYDESFAKFLPSRKMNTVLAGRGHDNELYLNDYRNSVYFVDHLVGKLIAELDSLGMMDETVIVVTTEHGEEFDDNNAQYYGHGSNFTRYQIQVPLIIYTPYESPRIVTSVTSHVDIPPTLVQEYLGCTNDVRDYSDGLNLFGELPEKRPLVAASYFNHAFIIDDNVYAVYPVYTKKYKLGDINRAATRPPVGLLKELMADITRFYDGEEGREPDFATR